MSLLTLVEPRYTLDGNIVGFRGATGEDNFTWIRSDQIGHLLPIGEREQ